MRCASTASPGRSCSRRRNGIGSIVCNVTPRDQPGCFEGAATELARGWLEVSRGVADVTVFACGGGGLVETARNLASAYKLACQTRTAGLP